MVLEWSELDDNETIKAECKGYKDGLVRSRPGGWTMPPAMAAMVPTYAKMVVRPSDVWVVTYPKSGTTWAVEMVWQVLNKVDFEGGKVFLNDRFPHLELDTFVDFSWIFPGIRGKLISFISSGVLWWKGLRLCNPYSWLGYNSIADQLEAIPATNRRLIKTHIPLSLLPPSLVSTAKVIYVARNPKDVMVSYYHQHKLMKIYGYEGDFPNFAKRFMNNELMMGPFFQHVEGGWALKDHPNFLFIFYEDMKRDLNTVIQRVSNFLDSPLTEDQVEKLIEHLDIKNFKNNPAVNLETSKSFGILEKEGNFIRKGEVGGWKEEFEEFPEVENYFHDWVQEKLAASNVIFPDHSKM